MQTSFVERVVKSMLRIDVVKSMFGMTRSSSGWKGVFFRKTLIYVLLIACLPGLLLGIGMYYIITGQIERELLTQHQEQMRQHARLIDEQLSHLEISLSHWAFEPQFHERLREIDYTYDFQAVREVNHLLLAKQGSHPLVHSVELYMNGVKPYLFNPSFTLMEVKERERIEYYHTILRNRGSLFWESADQSEYHSLKLIHTISGDSPQPYGLLIVTLDEAKIRATLNAHTTQSGGISLLVDRDAGILFSSGESEDVQGFDRHLVTMVHASESHSGSFNSEWTHHNYSVSYETFDRINSQWIYISAVPTTSITSPVVFISTSIVYVSIAGLIVAAILSLVVSNRLYTPVGRLVSMLRGGDSVDGREQGDEFRFLEEQWRKLAAESLTMRMRMKEQLPLVKEGFLLQLIQGYLQRYSDKEISERMSFLGRDIDQHRMVAVYYRLTGYSYDESRLTSMDEELFTFAAANIVQELAQARFVQADVINFHDLSVGLLLFVPEGADYRSELLQLCDESIEAVNQLLHMRLTITISRAVSSVRHVSQLFQEVNEASIYREFADRNQVIELESLDPATLDHHMRYSFASERELIQTLRSGQTEEAYRVLEQFYSDLTAGSGKESIVLQGMLQLLGSILNAMLHSGLNPHELFKGVNMFDRLTQIREPADMLLWMKQEVIMPLASEMQHRSGDRLHQIVQKVIDHLREHYMDPNLSLDSCAEYAGTNHYTLSKAFKTYTGRNFIEYLTALRLEKAKDLIRHTELKMYVIAERVGYQNGYFTRLFKKMEGLTPKQFRDNHRSCHVIRGEHS